jgi:hypothetical protein
VLYDFTGNDVNTTVQKVADMVKEQWVSDVMVAVPNRLLNMINDSSMKLSRKNLIYSFLLGTSMLIYMAESYLRCFVLVICRSREMIVRVTV